MIPYRAVHFVGVLLPEMASLAAFTAQNQVRVTASDEESHPLWQAALERVGVTFYSTYTSTNLSKVTDLVVVSPYYDQRHPEVAAASEQKIHVMSATEYWRDITQEYRRMVVLDEYDGPLVATYLSSLFQQVHQPVNSFLNTLASSPEPAQLAVANDAEWAIMPLRGFKRDATTYEADFLSFTAEIAIIPSVRYNYPELNTTLDDVYQTFYRFVKNIPRKGIIIGNSDWPRMKRLRSHLVDRHFETYGLDSDAAWRLRHVEEYDGKTTFLLTNANQPYGPFTIPFTGETMVYAVTAVIVAALLLDNKPEVINRALMALPQLERYFSIKKGKGGRIIIDDQADHPDTVRAVLEKTRHLYPQKKIWCLYQPGSYLRTKAMAPELQESLALADTVYVADVKGYPKEKSEGLHSKHFIAEMRTQHAQTFYCDPSVNMTQLLEDRVALQDCIITLGVDGFCQSLVAPLLAEEESLHP